MKNFTAVIERDAETGLFVGWVPGFPGAHSQGETLDELRSNLQEVVEMLLEEGEPRLKASSSSGCRSRTFWRHNQASSRTPRCRRPTRRIRRRSRPNPAAAESDR